MARHFCFLLVLFCAACGSKTDAVQNVATRFIALNDRFDGVDPSDPSQLPPTGTASYDGIALINLPVYGARQPVYGDLEVAVDFGSGRGGISGEISNINGSVGTFDGSLSISDSRLDRNADPDVDFTYSTNIDGTLTQNGVQYDIDGAARGEFLGRFQDGTRGVISGTVTVDGNRNIFDGSYIAERTEP